MQSAAILTFLLSLGFFTMSLYILRDLPVNSYLLYMFWQCYTVGKSSVVKAVLMVMPSIFQLSSVALIYKCSSFWTVAFFDPSLKRSACIATRKSHHTTRQLSGGLSILAKELTAGTSVMEKSSNKLSTLISDNAKCKQTKSYFIMRYNSRADVGRLELRY